MRKAQKREALELIASLHQAHEEIKEALLPKEYNLIVTPKEIDDLIENMKEIVATGINGAM